MAVDPYGESAFARARRDFPGAFTGTIKAWAWNLCVSVAGFAIAAWLSWHRDRQAQVIIGAAGLILGAIFAAVCVFVVVWLRSAARQRDEARTRIKELEGGIPIAPATTIFIGGTHTHHTTGDGDGD